jgi:hypothetical protein
LIQAQRKTSLAPQLSLRSLGTEKSLSVLDESVEATPNGLFSPRISPFVARVIPAIYLEELGERRVPTWSHFVIIGSAFCSNSDSKLIDFFVDIAVF